jgi:hypothetical protein
MGYSLDNQPQITMTENTTLPNLSDGPHNVTVYAKDEFENRGVSETVHFIVDKPAAEPSPMALVIASSAITAAIAVGVPVYFKKRNGDKSR